MQQACEKAEPQRVYVPLRTQDATEDSLRRYVSGHCISCNKAARLGMNQVPHGHTLMTALAKPMVATTVIWMWYRMYIKPSKVQYSTVTF